MSWREHRIGLLLVLLTVALTIGTVSLLMDPARSLVVVDGRLDLVINTAATLVAAAVAGLCWIHFREAGRVPSLYQGSAFLVLATVNAVFVTVTVLRLDVPLGVSTQDPGQGPLYVWTIARITAALLLVIGAMAVGRGLARPTAAAILLGPMLGVLVLFGVLLPIQDQLPPLVGGSGLMQLEVDPRVPSLLPGVTLGALLVHGFTGALFLAGAGLYYRLYLLDDAAENAFLAAGLVVAGFSQIHFALYPTVYASLVSTGDALRVVFYALLLFGALAATRSDVRALEVANADLERLRDAEVAAAALEERARLAREVHDGLAQDLFFAKLKQARLAAVSNLPRGSRALVDELGAAIENALSEARQVVMTMRVEPNTSDNSFSEVMRRFVDDFGDRVGVRTEFVVDGEIPPLSPRVQAELLRIVQEALNNAGKHADATFVRVLASAERERLKLTIADNGCGFEPERLDRSGFGLHSMRDRAAVIGGQLTVESRPLDGTRITAQVPLAAAPSA